MDHINAVDNPNLEFIHPSEGVDILSQNMSCQQEKSKMKKRMRRQKKEVVMNDLIIMHY